MKIYLFCIFVCCSCNLSDSPPNQRIDKDSGGIDIVVPEDQRTIDDDGNNVGNAFRATDFSPENLGIEVARGAKITFKVDRLLIVDTVNAEAFRLKNQAGDEVDATRFVMDETVILVPTSPLSLSETYTASIESERILDAMGVPLLSHTWSFTVRDGDWQTPVRLDDSDGLPSNPKVAADRQGNAAAIWSTEFEDDTSRILASRFENGEWESAQTLTATLEETHFPTLNFDSIGQLIAIWYESGNGLSYLVETNTFTTDWGPGSTRGQSSNEPSEIKLASDDSGNTFAMWATEQLISNRAILQRYDGNRWEETGEQELDSEPEDLFLGIGGNGEGFAGWTESGDTFISLYSPGGWSDVSEGAQDSDQTDISMNKNGDVALVWRTYDGDRYQIWVARRVDGEWTEAESVIEENVGLGSASEPRIDINDNGDVCMIWYWGQTVIGTCLNNDGSWASKMLDQTIRPRNTEIKMDHLGNAFAIWNTRETIKVKRFTKTEGWTNALAIENGVRSDIAISPSGDVFLVWESTSRTERGIFSAILN